LSPLFYTAPSPGQQYRENIRRGLDESKRGTAAPGLPACRDPRKTVYVISVQDFAAPAEVRQDCNDNPPNSAKLPRHAPVDFPGPVLSRSHTVLDPIRILTVKRDHEHPTVDSHIPRVTEAIRAFVICAMYRVACCANASDSLYLSLSRTQIYPLVRGNVISRLYSDTYRIHKATATPRIDQARYRRDLPARWVTQSGYRPRVRAHRYPTSLY